MIFLGFLVEKKMFAYYLFFLFFFLHFLILQEKDSWVIDDIRISGLQRVSAGSVFAVMPVGLGDEINQELFLKKLLHQFLKLENLMMLN